MSLEPALRIDSSSALLLEQMAHVNTNRSPRVTFPLPFYPADPRWHHGKYDQRQFHARREVDKKTGLSSRIHAGVDLEVPPGTPVLAMADGIVLRIASFYNRTDEVEVLHPGVGIVRYGEVKEGSAIRAEGAFVRQGQKLAVVGQRYEDGKWNPRAMLHLELFSDTSRSTGLLKGENNALSQGAKGTPGHPKFERRKDLQDPTKLLESAKLYKATLDMWPETWPQFTGFSRRVTIDAYLNIIDPRALLIGAPIFLEGKE